MSLITFLTSLNIITVRLRGTSFLYNNKFALGQKSNHERFGWSQDLASKQMDNMMGFDDDKNHTRDMDLKASEMSGFKAEIVGMWSASADHCGLNASI